MLTASSSMISIVTETFPPEINGVATTLGHVTRELEQAHRVQLIRPRHPAVTVNDSATDMVMVPSAPIPGYPELRFGFPAKRRLMKLWQQQRPTAVYVATQGPLGFSAVAAARRLGIPVVSGFHTNFHTYSQYYGVGWLQSLIRGYLRFFHHQTLRTLVPTRETADQIAAIGIRNAAVWSRGVDCALFSPTRRCNTLRRQWGVHDDAPVFIHVGRLAAEKNLSLAITAFREAQRHNPEARFVLVGGGPLQERIAAEHPDFIIAGVQRGEALARHYASADVFLFPSETDTFGNVVLEAMASRLALVSFDLAAPREHLTHGESALLAPAGDNAAFIQHAIALAGAPALIQRLGEAAQTTAQGIDWPSIVDHFYRLLTQQEHEDMTHDLVPSLRSLPQSR